MRAIFSRRAEVQKVSASIAQTFDDLVSAINSRPLEIGNVRVFSGTTTPEGKQVGNIGDVFIRTDAGIGTTTYTKESGTNTTTGWMPLGTTVGVWTPIDSSGAGLTITIVQAGMWSRVGHQMIATGFVTYPVTASGAASRLDGLPITSAATGFSANIAFQDAGIAMTGQVPASTTAVRFLTTAGGVVTNANLSGKTVNFTASYITA